MKVVWGGDVEGKGRYLYIIIPIITQTNTYVFYMNSIFTLNILFHLLSHCLQYDIILHNVIL